MKCPNCGGKSKTLQTRKKYNYRRKECLSCATRFTTKEAIVEKSIDVPVEAQSLLNRKENGWF